MIQVVLCAKGTKAGLYESGNLQYATLSQGQKVRNVDCEKDAIIGLRDSGSLKYMIIKGMKTSFDESGKSSPTFKE
jgi:hypothetical protein